MLISKNHNKSKPYKRKLHLSDGIWTYRIAACGLWLRSPQGTTTITTDVFEVNDVTPDDWYPNDPDADYTPPPTVPPSYVKDFLINKVLPRL